MKRHDMIDFQPTRFPAQSTPPAVQIADAPPDPLPAPLIQLDVSARRPGAFPRLRPGSQPPPGRPAHPPGGRLAFSSPASRSPPDRSPPWPRSWRTGITAISWASLCPPVIALRKARTSSPPSLNPWPRTASAAIGNEIASRWSLSSASRQRSTEITAGRPHLARHSRSSAGISDTPDARRSADHLPGASADIDSRLHRPGPRSASEGNTSTDTHGNLPSRSPVFPAPCSITSPGPCSGDRAGALEILEGGL